MRPRGTRPAPEDEGVHRSERLPQRAMVTVVPLIVGDVVPWPPKPDVFTSVATGTARRHAAMSGTPEQPIAEARPAPAASACASDGGLDLRSSVSSAVGARSSVSYSPLVRMPCSNRPAAAGDAIWSQALDPPADSPNIVRLRIAAEAGDVLLHPPERGLLIFQAVVAGMLPECRVGQEPGRFQAGNSWKR